MALNIIQVIAAVVLIISVLLQAQGGGISPAFGGGGEMYRSRQGIEKILIVLTIISALTLGVVSLIQLSL